MLVNKPLAEIATRLLQQIETHRDELIDLSMAATGNSRADTEVDLQTSIDFLRHATLQSIPPMRKPKGKVFIILSVNEPLLLSVIPIFCALSMKNEVTVRPSSKNRAIFESIWGNLVHEYKLEIILDPIEKIDEVIRRVSAVYFFGSHENARHVYSLCAKHFVEFIPEIEAADTKVVYMSPEQQDPSEIVHDIEMTLQNAYSHNGMICQRITGVYINQDSYKTYIETLHSVLIKSGFKQSPVVSIDGVFERDITASQPSSLYTHGESAVIIEPDLESDFANSAYFAKSLWVCPYKEIDDLVYKLNNRPYRLGLNIISNDCTFAEELILRTNFSRYTLRSDHCDISGDSGWGGNWPTGSGGYREWYSVFSDAYVVIR